MGWLESTAFGAALVFGFRHGFDWDHIAALTDLTGSQERPRRSMFLATLYAVGHAAMVLVLGVVAIVFAARLPPAIDAGMERFVGASLLALGAWIAWTAWRTRGAPPARSRWMLLIDLARRLRRRRANETVVIEHSHAHDHGHPLHSHPHRMPVPAEPEPEPVRVTVVTGHTHAHRHVLPAATDPFMAYGARSAFGIGLLHGIGAETPTQVLIFAAAANATDIASSIALLGCFLIGLVSANTVVALASTLGFRSVAGNRVVLAVLAALTAAFSLTLGVLLIAGRADVLPAFFSGG